MSDKESPEIADNRAAVGGPVQRMVRPRPAHVNKLENDMTDREMLEAAAKASGVDAEVHSELGLGSEGLWLKGERTPDNNRYWNPLENDGDALRLAVRLNIPVYPYDDETSTGLVGVVAKNWGSKEANTRRAIVQAAAAMAVG